MPAITLQGISKQYKLYSRPQDRVKEMLSFGRTKLSQDFWALKDISLEVEPGVTLGILGRNGAGKSTLLKIIAGVLQPTGGTMEINGRLAALLQLGAGFNAEFTGRENILLNGLILGIEREEMLQRFEEIAAFADLGEFMDQPVKTYSSGMRARLGFAVAVNVDPDIAKARADAEKYLRAYYGPHIRIRVEGTTAWGPFGDPERVKERMAEYAGAGAQTLIVRFASFEPERQLDIFLRQVAPAFT